MIVYTKGRTADSAQDYVAPGKHDRLDVPRHLWHFTPKTLASLLGACGLCVERIFHQKVLKNVTGSLDYLALDRPGLTRIARALEQALTPPWVSFALGAALAAARQGGRITVVSRVANG